MRCGHRPRKPPRTAAPDRPGDVALTSHDVMVTSMVMGLLLERSPLNVREVRPVFLARQGASCAAAASRRPQSERSSRRRVELLASALPRAVTPFRTQSRKSLLANLVR